MKYAQVLEVYLNDDAEFGPYSIQALLKESFRSTKIKAIPLNINQKYIPVVGEYVCIQKAPSDKMSTFGYGQTIFYYSNPVSLQGNVNSNILLNASTLKGNSVGLDYATTALGIPNPSIGRPTDKKNKEFIEVSSLSQLQPYTGDVIHEGRFGQSIRFGYTPQNAESSISPSWTSTDSEAPITILRNGAGSSSGYNKFVIEDVNEDASSIWMTSKQKVSLKPSNGFSLGILPVGQYSNAQLILNSDRVVINSKSDSVLISGKKSVNVSTPNWKADMDVMFTQLEEVTNSLIALSTKMASITAVPPLTPLAAPFVELSTKATQIKTQLTLMKQ